MAIINGTRIGIYVGGTKVAGATSASVSINQATRDATSKDSGGWVGSLEGLRDWSIEGEGFFNMAAAYGFDELFLLIESRATVTVRFSTETSQENYLQGTAILTSLSADAPVEDSATFSFSFVGTGSLANIAKT